MGYDRGDSFPFDFEPNGISIWFKNSHHDHISFTVKGNGNIVFSVNDVLQKLLLLNALLKIIE